MLGYRDRYQKRGGKVQIFIGKWDILWIIVVKTRGDKSE